MTDAAATGGPAAEPAPAAAAIHGSARQAAQVRARQLALCVPYT